MTDQARRGVADAVACAVSPEDIVWIDGAGQPLVGRCPVCGQDGEHRRLLAVPSLTPPHLPFVLARCASCTSAFYDPPGVRDFGDLDQSRADFWRLYVEVGGGVWETIWPLLIDRAEGSRTLLDVGCGFGFAVDFWRRCMGAEAVGVELADYGAIGARMLGIPVHREMLEDCAALKGRRFDVVYASEVVEHVPDPNAFVALLASRVAEDGLLVLTTPALDYIRPANVSPTLLAALSPGFHGFLLSAHALARTARAAGLTHVEVHTFNERQILWASRVPRRLDFDLALARARCFEYYESRWHGADRTSPLWQGYAYRYVRDLVGAGRLADARAKADALLAALEQAYGTQIREPAMMVEQLRKATTLPEFGSRAPFFLPSLYHVLGVIAADHDGDGEGARRWYQAAATLGRDCSRIGAVFFLEANHLVWPALAADAGIALAQGDASVAAATFARLAREGRRCRREEGDVVAEVAYIETVVPRACEGLVLAGAWDAARHVFTAYLDFLATSFGGRAWAHIDVLAEALDGVDGAGPTDPAFAVFFQALLDGADPNGPREPRPLRALIEFATSHREHPRCGAKLAHYAEVARRYLLTPPARTLFDFSYAIPASRPR